MTQITTQLTPIELNDTLDELGGRLLANQGPPTQQDAKRLVDALRQLRREHAALELELQTALTGK